MSARWVIICIAVIVLLSSAAVLALVNKGGGVSYAEFSCAGLSAERGERPTRSSVQSFAAGERISIKVNRDEIQPGKVGIEFRGSMPEPRPIDCNSLGPLVTLYDVVVSDPTHVKLQSWT